MNSLNTAVGITVGTFTAWNLAEAGLEHGRRYYPNVHIQLERVQKITDYVKTIFIALAALSMGYLLADPYLPVTHSLQGRKLAAEWFVVMEFIGIALLTLGINKVIKYTNHYFCKLDNNAFEDLIQQKKLPPKTIQWGFSSDRLWRQTLCISQVLLCVGAISLFSLPPLIIIAGVINIVVNLYSYFHISKQKEITLVSPKIRLTQSINGVETPIVYLTDDQFITLNRLQVHAVMTVIASPDPRDKQCPICMTGGEEEDPVDMQLCTQNHSTHAECFAALSVEHIKLIPQQVGLSNITLVKGYTQGARNRSSDYVRFTATIPKAANLFTCISCRQKSPFIRLKAAIDYSLSGTNKTSFVDIAEVEEQA